jgi:hypothetical protein
MRRLQRRKRPSQAGLQRKRTIALTTMRLLQRRKRPSQAGLQRKRTTALTTMRLNWMILKNSATLMIRTTGTKISVQNREEMRMGIKRKSQQRALERRKRLTKAVIAKRKIPPNL